MKAALLRSIEITPDTRATVMQELHVQLQDHLEIAAKSFLSGDFIVVESACGNAQAAAKALRENQELAMSRATVAESDTQTLWETIKKRADAGEADAIEIVKKAAKAVKEARSVSRV